MIGSTTTPLMILDACLRVGGPSQGADEMVALARAHGEPVFHRFEDIPGCAAAEG